MRKNILNRINKRIAILLTVATASTALCGFGVHKSEKSFIDEMFAEAVTVSPEDSELVNVASISETLTVHERPEVVEEMEKDSEVLMDPIFSLSTYAFPTLQVYSENDYFKYDLLEETNLDELDRITEPTNISVVVYRDDTYTSRSCAFSCFVYKIDPDYIYLGTAGHCIVDDKERAKIIFYDRTEVYVSLEDCRFGSNYGTDAGDYAMYRFPISQIPYDIVMNLKEVNYDKNSIANVQIGDQLYSGNIYSKDPSQDFDRSMIILDKCTDYVQNALIGYEWINSSEYFLADTPLINGQSGSAIFDRFGNLVGICSGIYTTADGTRWGVYTVADRLDELYNSFQ